MGAPDRIVRHLRLRADNESEVRHAARQLEDAMRCATLLDVGARVLLVRRLHLGRIPAGASSQTLALLLEQRVAAVGGAWVHGTDPSANEADYVFFRDALEARTELALRLVAGVSVAGWYWKLAAPEFKPLEAPQENLRRIALTLAALVEAPAALPAWVARLASIGAAPMLAAALGSAEGSALVHAAGLVMQSESRPHPMFKTTKTSRPSRLPSKTDEDHQAVSFVEDLRHELTDLPIWLQTLALAGGFTPRRVRSTQTPVAARSSARTAANIVEKKNLLHPEDMSLPNQKINDKDIIKLDAHPALKKPLLDKKLEDAQVQEESSIAYHESSKAWTLLDATPTACGGLLFLLSVLQRIGYPEWAEALPLSLSTEIVARILAQVLTRLQVPVEDAAWSFTHIVATNSLDDLAPAAPAIWQDPRLSLPSPGSKKDIVMLLTQAQTADMLAQVWLTACRRWLRRLGGIGIASLVIKPASMRLTPTHADAFFHMNDVDVRVRRGGLDFDPGWLPWYGRVVSFHYGQEGQS